MAEENTAAAAPIVPAPEPEAKVAPKVKTRKAKQRSCDEKNEKGKLCAGHLKRWFEYPAEIEAVWKRRRNLPVRILQDTLPA